MPVSSEIEMSVMKNKIAELKAQVNQQSSRDRERSSSTSGEGFNIVSSPSDLYREWKCCHGKFMVCFFKHFYIVAYGFCKP